jgi:prepilin-type N-terminal cleavage/methylation domain-containing protein
MRQRQQSGFTLIELMITVAVAVVLITLAVPAFRDLIDKSRLRGATDDLVKLLNNARGNAVKLGHNVNVAINGTTTWCAGAISATTPGTPGDPVAGVTACDCNTPSTCVVGDTPVTVANTSFGSAPTYVTLTSVDTAIASSGAGNGGITFTSKFGALDFSALPGSPLVELRSPLGKYSTRITISPLGQTNACSVGKFMAGYPSC